MINSPYHGIYRSPPYMPKPSKSRFNHLFCNRCHPNSLSDGNIPDLSTSICKIGWGAKTN
ncbi:hypothetical protein LguiA_024409 [Lonicera macranthoides]